MAGWDTGQGERGRRARVKPVGAEAQQPKHRSTVSAALKPRLQLAGGLRQLVRVAMGTMELLRAACSVAVRAGATCTLPCHLWKLHWLLVFKGLKDPASKSNEEALLEVLC